MAKLEEYRKKRRFDRTPEPAPREAERVGPRAPLRVAAKRVNPYSRGKELPMTGHTRLVTGATGKNGGAMI